MDAWFNYFWMSLPGAWAVTLVVCLDSSRCVSTLMDPCESQVLLSKNGKNKTMLVNTHLFRNIVVHPSLRPSICLLAAAEDVDLERWGEQPGGGMAVWLADETSAMEGSRLWNVDLSFFLVFMLAQWLTYIFCLRRVWWSRRVNSASH